MHNTDSSPDSSMIHDDRYEQDSFVTDFTSESASHSSTIKQLANFEAPWLARELPYFPASPTRGHRPRDLLPASQPATSTEMASSTLPS